MIEATTLESNGMGSLGFMIRGNGISGTAGVNANYLGDINGDGLGDIMFSDSSSLVNSGSGRAFVVFGKTSSNTILLSDVINGTGGFFDCRWGRRRIFGS